MSYVETIIKTILRLPLPCEKNPDPLPAATGRAREIYAQRRRAEEEWRAGTVIRLRRNAHVPLPNKIYGHVSSSPSFFTRSDGKYLKDARASVPGKRNGFVSDHKRPRGATVMCNATRYCRARDDRHVRVSSAPVPRGQVTAPTTTRLAARASGLFVRRARRPLRRCVTSRGVMLLGRIYAVRSLFFLISPPPFGWFQMCMSICARRGRRGYVREISG